MTDEIGWLDFYATCPCVSSQERRRSKQHAVQAEKEIVLSTVFTVCYDVFSGFAHFSRSTQQLLDADLLAFLLQRLLMKSHISMWSFILFKLSIYYISWSTLLVRMLSIFAVRAY